MSSVAIDEFGSFTEFLRPPEWMIDGLCNE
jgi:hypothetical protein